LESPYQSSRPLVLRADLDGANQEVLISGDEPSSSIALDLRADMTYYTVGQSQTDIFRANLDGSDAHRILDVNVNRQIAVDPSPQGGVVPAVSTRGLTVVVLAILLLSAVVLRRRAAAHAEFSVARDSRFP